MSFFRIVLRLNKGVKQRNFLTGKVVFGFANENKLFKENQVNELMARKFYRMHNSYLENVSKLKIGKDILDNQSLFNLEKIHVNITCYTHNHLSKYLIIMRF